MAYGFNNDRSKVSMYTKQQIDQFLAPVEGVNASTNYAVGDYFIHEDTLYLVTSAITTGDVIVPNTNCVATTIMAELVRLTS